MKSDSHAVWIIKDTVWGHRRLVADTCEIFGMVNIRGVTIHRYGSIYRYNVWRYDASMPRGKYRYLSYKKPPLFWHCPYFHIRLCITTNACTLVQSHISGLDMRTARRHKASIKDARDFWRNSRALCEKFPVHAHRQTRQLCVNTELSSPPHFWAWMNKFRQNYINMHVLANILVNSRLSIAYVLM